MFCLLVSVNKFLNFCAAYFRCLFLKMATILSHSHFLHVAFAPILVFQTFDRMIFGTLTFAGTTWFVLTVRDQQIERDQKKFGNCWCKVITPTRKAVDFKHASQWQRTHKYHESTRGIEDNKQTLALRHASEESACFLLSFFCHD